MIDSKLEANCSGCLMTRICYLLPTCMRKEEEAADKRFDDWLKERYPQYYREGA